MIDGLVEELRRCADNCRQEENGHEACGISNLLSLAAATIDGLAAELDATNADHSGRLYSGGWISCRERLPEPGEIVLVKHIFSRVRNEGSAMVTIGRLTPKKGRWMSYWEFWYYKPDFERGSIFDNGIICPGNEYVTAWMPLPSAR